MKKSFFILPLGLVFLLSSCAPFDVHEAAHFHHACPSKHQKKLHRYKGKLYYS
jgi:hypothetical protein